MKDKGYLIVMLGLAALGISAATRPAGRTLECPRARAAPAIDGKLDDLAWREAGWTEDFVDLQTCEKADVRARAKVVADEQCLYVGVEIACRDVRAGKTERDSVLHADDDVFELFLDPDGDGADYCEVQVNARGTVMDLLMSRPYDLRGRADRKWDIAGLRAGVWVDGTINDAADVDRGWSVELAIPWESVRSLSHEAGQSADRAFRLQLAHVYHGGRSKPTYLAWSPQARGTYHAPGDWGTLRVTSASTSRRTSDAATAGSRPSPGEPDRRPPSP